MNGRECGCVWENDEVIQMCVAHWAAFARAAGRTVPGADGEATLRRLADRFGMARAEALELAISEFAPSTPAERLAGAADRRAAMGARLGATPDEGRAADWRAGFRAGWELYQVRHAGMRAAYDRARARQGLPPWNWGKGSTS